MRWLREPLLHFLLLGAALFAVYAWTSGGAPREAARPPLRIGEADVRWLRETWTRQWQREPTPEELRNLVTEYVREELFAREARDMGLDVDDPYVRRRLAQKMEFLVQDTSRLAEPTEEELRKSYEAHPDLYRTAARISFVQVFLDRAHRDQAEALRARLEAGGNPMELGDPLLVEPEFRDATREDIAAQVGPAFADAVFALEPGGWKGPIESTYGLHLVRVTSKEAARPREFDAVREQVLDRWRDDRRRADRDALFERLLRKVDLQVEEAVKPLVGPLNTREGNP